MTKQEIVKAIQDNKIQIKASTDAKFATISWFDNESQTWKESNTFIRDVIQGASNFADLNNDTNAPGQNGQEVINNIYQVINQHTSEISTINTELDNKLDTKIENADGSKTEILRFAANDSISMSHTKAPGEVDSNGALNIRLTIGNYSDHEQVVLRVGDKDNKPIDYVPTHNNSMVNKGYVDKITNLNVIKLPYEQTSVGYVEFQVNLANYPNGIQGTVALIEDGDKDAFRSIPFYVNWGMSRINIGSDGRGTAYMYTSDLGVSGQRYARFGFNSAVVKGTIECIANIDQSDANIKVQHPTRQTEEAE